MDDCRLRSRRRAARALAEKRRRGTTGVSCDEESPTRERAKPPRRKKKEPIYEEDVIDGFAILSFKNYEDIEISLKMGKGPNNGTISVKEEETPTIKQEPVLPPSKPVVVEKQVERSRPFGLGIEKRIENIKQEAATSDDSSREKEKPRERERERVDRIIKREAEEDRLSDASSRCSSGKGYICDSEDDDKASDSGSVLFSETPPPVRKQDGGDGESGGSGPAAPAVAVNGHSPPRQEEKVIVPPSPQPQQPPPIAVQPPPSQLVVGNGVGPKTERMSPAAAVVSSYPPQPPPAMYPPGLGGYHPPPQHSSHQPPPPVYHPPLYAPYNSTPYLPPAAQRINRSPVGLKIVTTTCAVMTTTTTTSHRETVNSSMIGRTHSPRGHSPTRERDSYSSNVSSLSRGSVGTPVSLSPYHPPPQQSSLSYTKPSVWVSSSSGSQVPSAARISHPQFPAPMFPPAPPPVSTAPPAPNPFSAESLFQSNQGDLLRRELDSRFLATQDRGPYIRTEMHHHQHQHTHVHQHTTPIIPPPAPTLFTPPIFKEMPKTAGIDSSFYRQGLGFSGYPGYSPGLLHPTFGPSTPFAPPTHLPTFTPKQLTEPTKPKTVKTGKWNAMHVRVAWEIYHHQQKGGLSAESKVGSLLKDPLRPPTHMFGPPFPSAHRPPPTFEPPPPPTAFPPMGQPGSIGFQGGSMFGRYAAAAAPPTAYPALPTFPHTAPPLHDPWTRLNSSRLAPPGFPTGWGMKPEPSAEEKSRERARREEKARRLAQLGSKVRERSPLRGEGSSKDEAAYLRQSLRPPHFPAPAWEHHYRYDPLRFNPLVAAALREEEAKLFYPGLRGKAPSPHQPKEESSQSR
nr:autism susceptibility gene 2 protein isoform X3 [Halyomorpha halys]